MGLSKALEWVLVNMSTFSKELKELCCDLFPPKPPPTVISTLVVTDLSGPFIGRSILPLAWGFSGKDAADDRVCPKVLAHMECDSKGEWQ